MGEWIEGCMLHMATSIKVDTCRRYSPGRNKLPDSGLGPIWYSHAEDCYGRPSIVTTTHAVLCQPKSGASSNQQP